MKNFLIVCIIVSCLTYTSGYEKLRPNQLALEEKASYPGLTTILGAVATLLEAIVAYGLGQGSVDGITSAVQGVFFQVSRMVSIQGLVGEIPMFGFVLQPLVGIAASILSNAPVLGGIMSFILVGPRLTAILGSGATLLEAVAAYLIGEGSMDDVTAAIQGVAFQIQRMISVQGLVGQIPMAGVILQPLVGIMAMVLSNAPMLGGILSYILVGPSVPRA